jgi:hypothetical protein
MRARGTIAIALAAVCAAMIGAPAAAEAPERADSSFVVGVVPQQPVEERDLSLMGAGGIDSFRVWLGWSAVEEQPGQFGWGAYDSLFAAAARHGVTPLPYLYGTPEWAARADGQGCSGSDCIPFAPRSNATRAAYANYAAQAVRRYGPGGTFWVQNPQLPYRPVRSWQIWNEQNLPDYWRPQPDVTSYALLLRASAAAIRSVDPGAEVILGGMWGPRKAPANVIRTTSYLRRLYAEPGARESFDAFGVHPYDPQLRGVIRQIRRLRFVASKHGDAGVDIWVTELGWASKGPKREPLVKTRREQARLLRGVYRKLMRRSGSWNVRGVYWYAWRDTPRHQAICDWCPWSGLHSVKGGPKPAWRDLSALARR